MQNNLIKIQDGTIYRILQERDSEWLVIDAISAVRCNAALDSSWKKRIDKDYKKRGQHSRVD